jgi:endonuclease/exonuclease/phosphatase family metal-dependent hydrolase
MRDFMNDLGYDCVQQLKPHEVKLALFWRRQKLRLQWHEERSRALLAEFQLLSASKTRPQHTQGVADRDAISSFSVDDGDHPMTFYCINVHLEAKPERAADRVNQLRHALQRLTHHIAVTRGENALEKARVVVAGDFNSGREDPPCVLLRDGEIGPEVHDSGNPDEPVVDHPISHDFCFQEAYDVAHVIPGYTRRLANEDGGRVDFIWASKEGMRVMAVMDPIGDKELIERVGLPNLLCPSDHLPVGACFNLE